MGFGSFLKRITTIPSHGPLSPLRKVFGKTPLDEIGQVGGFLVGGPAGAAAGGALGSLVHGAGIGSAIKNAAIGYAGGVGANAALAGFGGGGLSGALGEVRSGLNPLLKTVGRLTGVGNVAGGAAPGDAAAQPRSGGIGSAIANVAGTFAGQNGAENQLRALGLLAGTGGAYMTGRAADQQQGFANDQVSYARERNAALDPMRSRLFDTIIGRLGGGVASSLPAGTAPPSAASPSPAAPVASPPAFTPPMQTATPRTPLAVSSAPLVHSTPEMVNAGPFLGAEDGMVDEYGLPPRRRRPGIGAALASAAY